MARNRLGAAGLERAGEVLRRVQIFPAARGEAQTRQTLQVMAQTARQAVTDPALVQLATDLVRHIRGRHLHRQIDTIARWARRRLEFLADPLVDGDWIRAPRLLMSELERHGRARADCDDAAVLVAALGMAVGLPARFRAVAFAADAPYEHVWTELEAAPGRWVPVDPTRQGTIEHIHRSLILELRG